MSWKTVSAQANDYAHVDVIYNPLSQSSNVLLYTANTL